MSAQPTGPAPQAGPGMNEEQLQQLANACALRPGVTGQQILHTVMEANARRDPHAGTPPLPHANIKIIVKRALGAAFATHNRPADPAPAANQPRPLPRNSTHQDSADHRWSLPGFDQDWADWWLPTLTRGDMACLVYILRRTNGFQRESDSISLEQFSCGIVTRDGKRLDEGTGLSRPTVARALKHLRELGLILAESTYSPRAGTLPTVYRINPNRPRRPYPRLISETGGVS